MYIILWDIELTRARYVNYACNLSFLSPFRKGQLLVAVARMTIKCVKAIHPRAVLAQTALSDPFPSLPPPPVPAAGSMQRLYFNMHIFWN